MTTLCIFWSNIGIILVAVIGIVVPPALDIELMGPIISLHPEVGISIRHKTLRVKMVYLKAAGTSAVNGWYTVSSSGDTGLGLSVTVRSGIGLLIIGVAPLGGLPGLEFPEELAKCMFGIISSLPSSTGGLLER